VNIWRTRHHRTSVSDTRVRVILHINKENILYTIFFIVVKKNKEHFKEEFTMRTAILGKKIENIYGVNYNQKQIEDENGFKTVYTAKPTLHKESVVKEWVEVCSYEGEPRYNSKKVGWLGIIEPNNELNISKYETVMVENEVFRADLNEMHLKTDKIVEEIDVDENMARINLSDHIRAFNSMMITSNEKLKSYCDIHKLSYQDTDAIELFDLVFPGEKYEIVDGVMKVKEKAKVVYLSSADYDWSNATTTSINFCNNSSITAALSDCTYSNKTE
jgi:hypothetical protein